MFRINGFGMAIRKDYRQWRARGYHLCFIAEHHLPLRTSWGASIYKLCVATPLLVPPPDGVYVIFLACVWLGHTRQSKGTMGERFTAYWLIVCHAFRLLCSFFLFDTAGP